MPGWWGDAKATVSYKLGHCNLHTCTESIL